MAEIKRETEFNIGLSFCVQCNADRFFYRRKDALKDDKWFYQLCGNECDSASPYQIK